MKKKELYNFFLNRYFDLKEKYDELVILGSPDIFIVEGSMKLNKRLADYFKNLV